MELMDMDPIVDINGIYVPSDNVVAREIEGELILVPLISGIGDLEEDLFSLNETGKAIWEKLNGENSLEQLIRLLGKEYESPLQVIKEDVLELVRELLKRKMVKRVERPGNQFEKQPKGPD